MENKKIYAVDLLKFFAIIMITNSHFIPVYKDVNIGFATLGVHGNVLFFFVSGFLLTMGFLRKDESLGNWYKKRMRRLWPALFLWALFSAIVWQSSLTWQKILIAPGYWFLRTIAVYYLLFFFVGRFLIKHDNFIRKLLFVVAICISVVYAFVMPQGTGSMFHTQLRYVCNFSIMIMGGMVFLRREEIKLNRLRIDLFLMVASFVAYFAIQSIGKNTLDWRWYTQIISLIPLHVFCYYAYKVSSYKWVDCLMKHKFFKWIFSVPAALTLEIYIVQPSIISDRFNSLFPLSWFIVFGLILVAAYILRIFVNVFLQFCGNDSWNLKEWFLLSKGR